MTEQITHQHDNMAAFGWVASWCCCKRNGDVIELGGDIVGWVNFATTNLPEGVAAGLCIAIADLFGVEVHPAGTAVKIQESADCIRTLTERVARVSQAPEPEPEPTLTESADGRREWRLNGVRHREDGPAIELPDGRREWWLNGVRQPEPDKGGRQ